jgi:hypothetical protein
LAKSQASVTSFLNDYNWVAYILSNTHPQTCQAAVVDGEMAILTPLFPCSPGLTGRFLPEMEAPLDEDPDHQRSKGINTKKPMSDTRA